MRHTLIILIALLLSSCSAQWHIKRAIELDPNIISLKLTTLKEVHKRDTLMWFSKTILLAMPHDTAKIDSVVFKDTSLSFGPIVKKQGIVTLTVSMTNGVLHASASVDSTMIYNLRDSIRIKNAIIEKQTTTISESKIIVEKQESVLETVKQWALIIISGFIVFSVFKFFSKYK